MMSCVVLRITSLSNRPVLEALSQLNGFEGKVVQECLDARGLEATPQLRVDSLELEPGVGGRKRLVGAPKP